MKFLLRAFTRWDHLRCYPFRICHRRVSFSKTLDRILNTEIDWILEGCRALVIFALHWKVATLEKIKFGLADDGCFRLLHLIFLLGLRSSVMCILITIISIIIIFIGFLHELSNAGCVSQSGYLVLGLFSNFALRRANFAALNWNCRRQARNLVLHRSRLLWACNHLRGQLLSHLSIYFNMCFCFVCLNWFISLFYFKSNFFKAIHCDKYANQFVIKEL